MTLADLLNTLESADMLRIMSPLRPDETPDFKFQELQMKLYYTIYL